MAAMPGSGDSAAAERRVGVFRCASDGEKMKDRRGRIVSRPTVRKTMADPAVVRVDGARPPAGRVERAKSTRRLLFSQGFSEMCFLV